MLIKSLIGEVNNVRLAAIVLIQKVYLILGVYAVSADIENAFPIYPANSNKAGYV